MDVKIAFNSARWWNITVALDKMGVPNYILSLSAASYFKQISLTHSTDNSEKTYKVTTGVPQGSVLRPLL